MGVFNQPVHAGEVRKVTIEKEGDDGDGLAFVDGLVIVVPSTLPGDEVTIQIEDVKENYAFAQVLQR